jgi:hypothetical protein
MRVVVVTLSTTHESESVAGVESGDLKTLVDVRVRGAADTRTTLLVQGEQTWTTT